jgi:hypothetical protein
MNRFEGPGAKEARIRYLESIPLDELRYWSVARQEAYSTAAISLKREVDMNPGLRSRR